MKKVTNIRWHTVQIDTLKYMVLVSLGAERYAAGTV